MTRTPQGAAGMTETGHFAADCHTNTYSSTPLRKELDRLWETVCGCQCPLLWYTVVCWGGSISKKDTSRLDKLIRRAGGHSTGLSGESGRTRGLDKLLDIMDNASHPLHTVISNQRSLFSERLLLPKCRTNRLKNSFVHHAITLPSQLLTRGEEDI
ncbi:hypothetical protein L3Q82_021214, partial [Scortum barcoo]